MLEKASNETKHGAELELMLALSYGGRDEIVNATKKIGSLISEGNMRPEDITVDTITSLLYAPDAPDPELLIRTSGEKRISNFLLWQSAYSEFVFSDLHWPEFSKDEFYRCISEFQKRERRFGHTECVKSA